MSFQTSGARKSRGLVFLLAEPPINQPFCEQRLHPTPHLNVCTGSGSFWLWPLICSTSLDAFLSLRSAASSCCCSCLLWLACERSKAPWGTRSLWPGGEEWAPPDSPVCGPLWAGSGSARPSAPTGGAPGPPGPPAPPAAASAPSGRSAPPSAASDASCRPGDPAPGPGRCASAARPGRSGTTAAQTHPHVKNHNNNNKTQNKLFRVTCLYRNVLLSSVFLTKGDFFGRVELSLSLRYSWKM